MIKCLAASLATVYLVSSNLIYGQQPPVDRSIMPPLGEILRAASVRRNEYVELFKDLRTEETQDTEQYDAKGLQQRRRVVSDLFIYQSSLDRTSAVEYRNVRSVDGKSVGDSDRRAEKLFERLSKTKSIKSELERVDKESRRYDLDSSFYGFTLNQGRALAPGVTPYFRYNVSGEDKIDGHPVIVVDYAQTSPIPDDTVKLALPKQLQGSLVRDRGRMWLDRDTLRLRRDVRETTLEHPSAKTPLVLFRWELEYGASGFDILTPTHFVMSTFTRGRTLADGTPELLISGKVTSHYKDFTRFEVKSEYNANLTISP